MPGLQYDINAIIKAFFPDREIRVLEPDAPVHDQALLTLPVYMEVDTSSCTIRVDGRSFGYETDPALGAKNSFRLRLYEVMCELTGRTLPWGNLTGVRPTKIAMSRILGGDDDQAVLSYMKMHHRVSDAKAHHALDIAHRELSLIDRLNVRDGYSLYINIPFCPTRCLYCSFTGYSYEAWADRVDEYLDALFAELDSISDRPHPDTIYIGGGTPTSLSVSQMERLFAHLDQTVDIRGALEFTCEAGRPDSITPEKLDLMKKYGVSRLSVNPQTMQQKTLDIIGRRTTPAQVIDAFHLARRMGFDNINMDIILGLPGEGEEELGDTLEQISALGPDSLTVHSLAIKRASALREHLDEIGLEALVNTETMMDMAAAAAAGLGLKPYYLYRQKNMAGNFENTGYARPGCECLYNIIIMEEISDIVALGAGAISKHVTYDVDTVKDISRCENPKDIDNYVTRIHEMIERKRLLFTP